MKNKIIKMTLSTLTCVLFVLSLFSGCVSNTTPADTSQKESTTEQAAETVEDVTISDEVVSMANDTKEMVDQKQDLSSEEIIESSEDEEITVIDEGALENDGTVQQENFSWNGDAKAGEGLALLGGYQGLTYYNQADSRWASLPYTSTGNKTQTMASSACGPTSAAMVVSSSKGAILPTTMATLFVDNGYRTADNGTAWACWAFVADYFGFNEYYTTTSDSKMFSYLKTDKNNDGVSDYFVVASVGSGLWTTGGHYIVLVGDEDGVVTVYDPYLYNGKYNTASRRAAGVVVDGNAALVTEDNFKKYSNTVQYWIFSNDSSDKTHSNTTNKPNTSIKYTTNVGSTYKLKSATTLYSKGTLSGTQYQYKANTTVKVIKHYSASVDYIYVPATGRYAYVQVSAFTTGSTSSSSVSSSSSTNKYKSVIGSTYKLKSNATLYSKGNLTGTKYQYLKNTTVKVLSHYSSSVDYIYVLSTGRYAYLEVDKFTSGTASSTNAASTSYKTSVGSFYRLKTNTTLYSKGTLSGAQYQYLPQTQIKVIKHYSSTVDYIYVVKTGRYAYCKVSNFA